MWKELGVTDSIKFHVHNHYAMIDGGKEKLFYKTDKDSVEDQMLRRDGDTLMVYKINGQSLKYTL